MVTASENTPSTTATTGSIHAPQRRYRIPTEKVRAGLQSLPEEQRDDVFWFHRHCMQADPDKETLGRLLRKPGATGFYSADSISQLLTGFRAGKGEPTETIWQAIVAYRRVVEPREAQAQTGFIETRLFREIERRCLQALRRQRIGFVFGDSQIGKSASFGEVRRRHNHGQTVLVEVPAGGSLGSLLIAWAEALDIRAARKNQRELKEAIMTALDSNNLVILDEAHRFFEGRSKGNGIASLSFIREVWNRCQCGMMFGMTNEGRDELLTGRHAKALQQIWRRRITPLQLPSVPPDDDAALFAQAFGLPAAPDETVAVKLTLWDEQGREKEIVHQDNPLRLQREQLRREGLGVWIGILEDAADMARDAGRQLTWPAVLKAHAQAQADAEIYK